MTGRLIEDHVRARNLALGLKQIPGLLLDQDVPATNMVFLSLSPQIKSDARIIVEKLKEHGILAGVTGQRSFRLVLHYWIDDSGVEKTIAAFKSVLN
jgi:threonine aldolase